MHHFRGEARTPGLRSLPDLFLEASREDASPHLWQAQQENKRFGEKNGKAHNVSKIWCILDTCLQGRQRKDTIDMGVFSKASAKQGFPGEGEDCMQDLALVYSFIVPHCPQMCAGWKVPDVAAANTNSASH